MFKTILRPIAGLALAVGLSFMVGCAGSQAGLSSYEQAQKAALDTIKAGRFDGGRMWTFDYPPIEWFKEAYNFAPDQKWLDDVRLAALRFAGYCSASFVSEDGLVMTNHHCARESVEAVSKQGEHLVEQGYWAPTMADERKVASLYVDQLAKIQDVTGEVQAAMDKGTTDSLKIQFRDDAIIEIQKRLGAESKLRVSVTSLYDGGRYSAYMYKRYSDVRLVFAPEVSLGFFGGDWDNFTYPRYDLDCSFFRVYDDNGKPLKTEHFYKWSQNGAAEGELVFVVGNPGSTGRLSTAAQLEFDRDYAIPFTCRMIDNRVDIFQKYADRHPEKREEMINQLFSISNSQKVYKGQLAGLRDDKLMQRRKDFDRQFRENVEKRPELKAKYGQIWGEIAEARQRLQSVATDYFGLRFSGMGGAEHMGKAASLVRMALEMRKPDSLRAKPYQGKSLDLIKRSLMKPVKPDADMEELTLVKQLETIQQVIGNKDEVTTTLLAGQSPEQATKRLFGLTILKDSVKVAELVNGAPASIEESTDPFIVAARLAAPRQENAQKVFGGVRTRDQLNQTLLGRALYDVYGTSIPPDATFTLRLADGVVKGYEYNGTKAPVYTTFYGLYDRYYSFPGDKSWELPERWINRPADFDLSKPMNFVSTNDIIGGNSGSPIINKNKEVVGLIFDGNIESLPGEFIFAEDANNRSVSVHSAGMVHAIRFMYKAARLADELEAGKIR
jgi:hypothetical protein